MFLFILVFPFIFIIVALIFLKVYLPLHFNLIPLPPDLIIKKPLPSPPPKGVNISGMEEWISVFSNPLQLKSECVIIYGKEEHIAQFGVDEENIILKMNNQTFKSKINGLTITNIYFSKTKINKNNFIQLSSSFDIIPSFDSVCLRFRQGYEMEYWYYYLKACQKGRRKYYAGDEAFCSLFKELSHLSSQNSKETMPWIELSNFFISRIFYTNSQTETLKDKIKNTFTRKLQNVVCPFIPFIKCSNCSLGSKAPLIKSIISHIPKETDGRFDLDCEIIYNGSNFIEITTSFVIPYIIEEPIPIKIIFSIPQISGNCRINIPDVPSKSVYFSFHQIPHFTIKYQFQIGKSYFIPTKVVDSLIRFIADMTIVKKMLLPSLLRIPIPQISEITRPTQIDTYNPFIDIKYKLPDLPFMSNNLNAHPHQPDVLKNEELKNRGNEIKKTGFFRYTCQLATKFFDAAVSGEFKKDFRSEKMLEKHQKIVQKEQHKQERKELKNFQKREKRHTIQTTLEEWQSINEDIKRNGRMNEKELEGDEPISVPIEKSMCLKSQSHQNLMLKDLSGDNEEIIEKELMEHTIQDSPSPNGNKLFSRDNPSSYSSFEFMKQNSSLLEDKSKSEPVKINVDISSVKPHEEESGGTPKRTEISPPIERVRSASPIGENDGDVEEKKRRKISFHLKEKIKGSSTIQSAISRVRHTPKVVEEKKEKK